MIDIPDSIFPKDAQGNALCPRCQQTLQACSCPGLTSKPVKKIKIFPKVRLERSGRNGKIVTVIHGLPANTKYLKDLASLLKKKTGSGGTSYIIEGLGVIEIQGDHQAMINDSIPS